MKADDFRARTKAFAVAIVQMFDRLPRRTSTEIVGRQLLRSATSVGAQYREACRARSRAEFVSKVESATQEADESQFWLEILRDGCGVRTPEIERLWQESDELIAILVSMAKKSRG